MARKMISYGSRIVELKACFNATPKIDDQFCKDQANDKCGKKGVDLPPQRRFAIFASGEFFSNAAY